MTRHDALMTTRTIALCLGSLGNGTACVADPPDPADLGHATEPHHPLPLQQSKPNDTSQSRGGELCVQPIRVLIADDHVQFRQGLRGLLEGFPGIAVVGEAGDGKEAVRLAAHFQPDLVLMDVQLPRLNGYDATRCIRAHTPAPVVIGLSVGRLEDVEEGMLAAGAFGYLCKAEVADRLFDVIVSLFPEHDPARRS